MTAIYSQLIEKAIHDWIAGQTELPCIAERQKIAAPRPTGEFCSYLIGPTVKLGQDDLQGTTDTFVRSGPRVFTCSVSVYSEEAFSVACYLRNSLELESVKSAFKTAGIHVQKMYQINDTSAFMETGFERRATIDLSFCTTESISEEIGYIAEVELSQE